MKFLKVRRNRAMERETKQEKPNYEEMERRLLADNIDFSEDKLNEAGITRKQTFENDNLDKCVEKIINYIQKEREKGLTLREKYKVDVIPQVKLEQKNKEKIEERGISR